MRALLARLAHLSPVVVVRRSTVRDRERDVFFLGVDAAHHGLIEKRPD